MTRTKQSKRRFAARKSFSTILVEQRGLSPLKRRLEREWGGGISLRVEMRPSLQRPALCCGRVLNVGRHSSGFGGFATAFNL